MSSGTLRQAEAFVVVRSSFVVLELRTVFPPRRGPFGSAAPIGLVFRRNARWGCTGVTGTPRVATRPDRLPEVPPTALRRSNGPARSGTKVAVKIAGQQRYITDSKTAAKPSSDFTLRYCQAFGAPVFWKSLKTRQIQVQNKLERLAKLGSKMSFTLLKRAPPTNDWWIS